MRHFKFELGQIVRVAGGNETGKIIGRGEYDTAQNTYYVRYVAGDGRAVETWWGEDALTSAD
jgi:hypothetical protein